MRHPRSACARRPREPSSSLLSFELEQHRARHADEVPFAHVARVAADRVLALTLADEPGQLAALLLDRPR